MIRKIVYLPDPVLRQVGKEVEVFDQELQTLIDDMFETMYAVKGVGLAAPQVGVSLQLAVVDVEGDGQQTYVLINPKITASEGRCRYKEGCLSVPGVYEQVERAERVTLQALDRHGNPYEVQAEGLLGECFQHEIDHLNGKLFVDYLSPLKRSMARRKLEKYKRQHG
jgi:peptide deformylase